MKKDFKYTIYIYILWDDLLSEMQGKKHDENFSWQTRRKENGNLKYFKNVLIVNILNQNWQEVSGDSLLVSSTNLGFNIETVILSIS